MQGDTGTGGTGGWMIQVLPPASADDPPLETVIAALRADPQIRVTGAIGARVADLLVVDMPDTHPARLRSAFPGRLVIERNGAFPLPVEPLPPPA